MGLRTSVEVAAGVPVVCQIADGADLEWLQRRAAGLAAAAGPGVVAVLRSGATADGGWELITAHAGLPLAAARLDGPSALATIGARVADTLARLHAAGVVHGRLEVEHVVVDTDGGPVLCGIEPSDRAPSDDVAALGRILLELAADLVIPESFEIVLAHACDGDPERRPTARRLAADLAAIAEPARTARAAPKRAVPKGAILAASLLLVALVVVTRRSASAPASGTAATTVVSSTSTSTSITSSASPGGVVEVDGRRIVVGRPTDEVLMGDWGCEGLRPAVLRPGTGEVLVFGTIAPGAAPEVVQAERIEGATGLHARTEPDGCASLLVLTDTGPIRLT